MQHSRKAKFFPDTLEKMVERKANCKAMKKLSPEARRALAEAEARRAASDATAKETALARELGGREGPEPTRYGDWEKKGIASDF